MGSLHKSAATLGFWGDEVDPTEVTTALGREPTVGVAKGGAWKTKRGYSKIAYTGSWRLHADDCLPGNLDQQINELLGSLSSDLAVWQRLTKKYRARVFCGLFLAETNEGLGLNPRTLQMMGERGLTLELDIYAPADDIE